MASGSSGFVQVDDTDFHEPAYADYWRPWDEMTVEEQVLTRRSCHIHARWGRVIRMLRRIRFLQRTWGQLGGFLQSQWSPALRNGIRDHMYSST